MNLLFLESIAPSVIVDRKKLRHLQLSVGDTLQVGELNGLIGEGKITALSTHNVTLEIKLNTQPPIESQTTLILSMVRPKMLKRIFRTISMLGIKNIHLINCYNVDKSYWQTELLENNNYRPYFIQGLEQAKDTVLPQLSIHKLFKPFVEDQLPKIIEGQNCIVAHPYAKKYLPSNETIDTLIIGPERGFTQYEVEMFENAGAHARSFSNRILRTEDFISYSIGRIHSQML